MNNAVLAVNVALFILAGSLFVGFFLKKYTDLAGGTGE